MECGYKLRPRGKVADWEAEGCEAVLGGALGSISSCYVIQEGPVYKMWFTWQQSHCIAYGESTDGKHWGLPTVVLTPRYQSE